MKFLSFLFVLGLLSNVNFVYAELPNCAPAYGKMTNWNNCVGPYTYPNGNQYFGEWKDDKASGSGTLVFPDMRKYVGQFNDDVVAGRGTLYRADGSIQVSINSWDQYKLTQALNVKAGTILSNFNDSPSKRKVEEQNTSLSQSNFMQTKLPLCQGSNWSGWDNCVGQVILERVDNKNAYLIGAKYEGGFKEGKFHGKGILTWPNGKYQYIGNFVNGDRSGYGTFTFGNGTRYEGNWNGHAREGFGTANFPNGDKYIGEWKNDFQDGQGTLTYADGRPQDKGVWVKGNFQPLNPVVSTNQELSTRLNIAEINKQKIPAGQVPNSYSPTVPSPIIVVSPNASFTGRRLALVIGNATYRLHPLDNPKNDADDMSRVLRSTGFEVIDIRDASLAQMRSAVRQFGDKLLTKDVGLVYYSGHGMEVKGRNYFIPVNADIKRSDEVADQSLDVSLILDKMETAKKGINILIVDACRDDPFGRSFRSGNRGLATMDAPQGTIIAFATSPGKVAADGSGRNSPYTKNLVRLMQVPNMPIEQVFKQVRRAVQEETRNQQTPWENTSLSGDFYFSVKR